MVVDLVGPLISLDSLQLAEDLLSLNLCYFGSSLILVAPMHKNQGCCLLSWSNSAMHLVSHQGCFPSLYQFQSVSVQSLMESVIARRQLGPLDEFFVLERLPTF